MLLSKVKKADTGDTELDRVCQGLRMTMGWLAEAIERSALSEAGYEDKREPPRTSGGHSPGSGSHEDKVVSS